VILVLGGQKGGVGKSTIATSMVAELLQRKLTVLLVDADEQGTANTWVQVAKTAEHPVPKFLQLSEDNLHKKLGPASSKVDHTIIDLPSRLGPRQRSALAVADAVLLPCGPSAADMWALTESVEMVTSARKVRPDLRAFVFVNRTQKHTTAGRTLRDDLRKWGLEVLYSQLSQRVAYRDALAAGLGVTTISGAPDAKTEMLNLVDEILNRMKPKDDDDGEEEVD